MSDPWQEAFRKLDALIMDMPRGVAVVAYLYENWDGPQPDPVGDLMLFALQRLQAQADELREACERLWGEAAAAARTVDATATPLPAPAAAD